MALWRTCGVYLAAYVQLWGVGYSPHLPDRRLGDPRGSSSASCPPAGFTDYLFGLSPYCPLTAPLDYLAASFLLVWASLASSVCPACLAAGPAVCRAARAPGVELLSLVWPWFEYGNEHARSHASTPMYVNTRGTVLKKCPSVPALLWF